MAREPDPVTLSQVARRAAEVVDPSDEDGDVADLLRLFEDADEPITAILPTLDERVAEAVGRIDPQEEIPAVQVMGAIISYLGRRRDEVTDVEADILRLAVRAEFDGDLPPAVANWLDDQGVSI